MELNHNKIQADFYDRMADNLQEVGLSYGAKVWKEAFFKFLDLKKEINILELGCGHGRWTLPLLRQGHKITAVDISQKSLEVLERRAKREGLEKNLKIVKSNFEKEEYNNLFDGALCLGVLHHLDPAKKEKIFTNVVRALKKGGFLAIHEPNPFNPLYYLLYLWRGIWRIRERGTWTIERGLLGSRLGNLKRLFQSQGLKDIKVRKYGMLPNRFADVFPFVIRLNEILVKVPIIRNMSAFVFMKGIK